MPGAGSNLAFGRRGGFVLLLLASLVVPGSLLAGAPPPLDARPGADASEGAQAWFVPGEIIVRLADDLGVNGSRTCDGTVETGLLEMDRLNRKHRVTRMDHVFVSPGARRSLPGVFKLSLSRDADIPAVARQYARLPEVRYAEPNHLYATAVEPDDPEFFRQWALSQPSDHDIDAPEAWDVTTGSPGVVIAIIDTGVQWDHPDLAGNIWMNHAERLDGEDTDGNGFVDDIRGWDFVDTTQPVAPLEDGTVRDNDPSDFYGHGTLCAGIAGAVTDNGTGIAGTCWNCRLMAVRAGFAGPAGSGWLEADDAAAAIAYAVDNGAHVISMSWGRERTGLIEDAIDYAAGAGVVLVAAAGNDGIAPPRYPAAHEPVIAVGATDQEDIGLDYSNHGSLIDLAAPGEAIYSTVPHDAYWTHSGTSMACPHVAGVAGLILAKTPSLSPLEVRTLLRSTAQPLSGSVYIGIGRLDAHGAVAPDATPVADLGVGFEGETVAGPVEITGTAAGSGFVSYALHHGSGVYPSAWEEIGTSSSPVEGGTLGWWDTRTVPDGPYAVRLVVTDDTGRPSEDRFLVTTDNVWLSQPTDHAVVRAGDTVEVRGNAAGPAFVSYDLAWGFGEDPAEWFTTGISLAGNGEQEVADGILATWDTGVIAADVVVSVRFTATFAGFQEVVHAREVRLDSTLEAGWPHTADEPVFSSPMPGSFDGGPEMQVLILTEGGKVEVRRADGSALPGWPAESPGGWQWDRNSTPVVADLDGDGLAEVVVASSGGELRVFASDGSLRPGWPQQPAQVVSFFNSPTVADLDRDGRFEILQRSDAHLLVFDPDGHESARWPVGVGDGGIAVADIDGDADLEIALADTDGRITLLHHDGTPVAGWPQELIGEIGYGGPVMGDVDGDGLLEVCVMARDGLLWVYDADGGLWPGWPRQSGYQSRSRPALADLDGDRALEILVTSGFPAGLYVVRADGTDLAGWPKTAPTIGHVQVGWSPPVVGDVDGDASPEVFAVSEATSGFGVDHPSRVHAWHADGTSLEGWPKALPANGSHSAPALGDLDGDGRFELVVTVESGSTYVFDLGEGDGSVPPQWGTLHHDPRHPSASPFRPFEICDDGVDNDFDGMEDCEDLATCEGLPCDDGDACTDLDTCVAGACVGAPVVCDDGWYCNGAETCDPVDGCQAGDDPCPDRPCREADDACVGPPWWNSNWHFRKQMELDATTDDHQIPVTIYHGDGHDDPGSATIGCELHCNEDFSDLRFLSAGQEIPHWIEWVGEDPAGRFARVWVRIPGAESVHLYYGNANAFDASNGPATFPVFDDFATDSLIPEGGVEGFVAAAGATPELEGGRGFEAIVRIEALAGHDAVDSGATVRHLEFGQSDHPGQHYRSEFLDAAGVYYRVEVDDGSGPQTADGGEGYADGAAYTVSLIRDHARQEVRGSVYAYGDRFAGLPPLIAETVAYPDAGYEFPVDRFRLAAGAGGVGGHASIVHDPAAGAYEITGGSVTERIHWIFVRRRDALEPDWSAWGGEEFIEDAVASCCAYGPDGTCDEPAAGECVGWVVGACCGDGDANGLDDGCEIVGLRVDRTSLRWTARHGAVGYDVIRGDLTTLLLGSGDYASAVDACLGNDLAATSLDHPDAPAIGEGHWYLVRGVTPVQEMTYSFPVLCVVDERDDRIRLSPHACP